MDFKIINKNFKVVSLKSRGDFGNFDKEVPALAKQLLSRSDEIESHTGVEIALFEPKRNQAHKIGEYLVGLIVNERLQDVPAGMHFIEVDERFMTARGKISSIGALHANLINWGEEQGYKRNLESYIIETYHPVEDGEEVQIYLPIF
ncbi:GyrI-like domain-containing protein [Ureibacillus chungkukjangi]|uniref:GyrI-like small molecule binding domain-containing protein n=1 Tax=Ureibacillus chungkukjangi TaxID=1202712 RepID=A0A318TZ90_9BACL|nr:AraC family transcriptional regulator [Ureibacillus chungkukjangi]PYF08358.1 hypothetical protein BJ095_102123 [Ureibacillus chungkukjangi]